jgi:hypothetical protein
VTIVGVVCRGGVVVAIPDRLALFVRPRKWERMRRPTQLVEGFALRSVEDGAGVGARVAHGAN